eukprot:TRINITY_DN2207_c0_g1_i1.p1 TRINITY_DN2207_c0_g1~~TRINITY_DN2207_c0_g1_i1.p1  ORF type:complete len:259 (-),score=17.78 TRINITY_DN2207_c0_g1_i1:184-930(-)
MFETRCGQNPSCTGLHTFLELRHQLLAKLYCIVIRKFLVILCFGQMLILGIPAGLVHPGDAVEVAPLVILGDVYAAVDTNVLRQHNIQRIVSIIEEAPPVIEGIQYLHIPVSDTLHEDILASFIPVINWITAGVAAHEAVLVHCRAGRSRSASFLLAYLMHQHSLSLRKAAHQIICKRDIWPNDSFFRQLKMFETRCGQNPSCTGLHTFLELRHQLLAKLYCIVIRKPRWRAVPFRDPPRWGPASNQA